VTAARRALEIIPSILAADFANLGADVAAAVAAGIHTVQVDVMDGRFVPNISVGVPVVAALKAASSARLDVHLMIEEPERYLEAFAAAGADVLTVHVEATRHVHRALQRVRELGVLAGAAINPGTPPDALGAVLERIDVALIMTVNPGFGGQRFIPEALHSVRTVAEWLAARGLPAAVQVDGGIDAQTIGPAAVAGATQFVAGSSVFQAGVPIGTAIDRLRAAVDAARG